MIVDDPSPRSIQYSTAKYSRVQHSGLCGISAAIARPTGSDDSISHREEATVPHPLDQGEYTLLGAFLERTPSCFEGNQSIFERNLIDAKSGGRAGRRGAKS